MWCQTTHHDTNLSDVGMHHGCIHWIHNLVNSYLILNRSHFVAEAGNKPGIHVNANDRELMLAYSRNEVSCWEILQVFSIDHEGSLFNFGFQVIQFIARIIATLGVVL